MELLKELEQIKTSLIALFLIVVGLVVMLLITANDLHKAKKR